MVDKKSFLLYLDYWKNISRLENEQRGILLTAIYAHVGGDELPEMDGATDMAFGFIQDQIDRDQEKYERTVKKRREAGQKGGRPKANGSGNKAKKANGFSEKQTKAKKPDNEDVNDNDNDNDIKTNKVQKAADLFERLWKLYPLKRGKNQVSDANKRRLLDIGYEQMERAISRYKADLAKETWRKPQNGSTFFNSGYGDYLDEEYTPLPAEKGDSKFHNFEERDYGDMDDLERKLLSN